MSVDSTLFKSKHIAMKVHFAGKQTHFFHIVTESPWPLCGSLLAFSFFVGCLLEWNNFIWFPVLDWADRELPLWWASFGGLILVSYSWWKDVVVESTYLGYHTSKVVNGLRLGMILFIVSEVMFFFSFFWAFFHASLSPSIVLGSVWPPIGINVLSPLHLPLLNTVILLSSGVAVTISHFAICCLTNKWIFVRVPEYWMFKAKAIWARAIPNWHEVEQTVISDDEVEIVEISELALIVTIILAFEFTCCQMYEYNEALFYINDGIFGSTFYLATGFHGLHVLIGTIFLCVCLGRMFNQHFLVSHHLGFEMAIWYWHFVDVVWLVLYVFIYCWSGGF